MMRRSFLAIAAATAAACSTPAAADKPLTPVTVGAVESYTAGTAVRYSATARPAVEVTLAFKTGGYVVGLRTVGGDRGSPRTLQEGDRVVKGAELARLRSDDYQQRATQARSGLAEANALHESARLDFERASRLYDRQSLTKPELDNARARLDAAAARVEGARAALNEAEIQVGDTVLRSPIDGIVLKRTIELGTLVSPGQPAFVLADTSSVKVSFGVPDVVVRRLQLGRPQRVAFDAIADADFEGRITSIAPAPDPVSRVYGVDVSIPNPKRVIEVGFVAELELADGPQRSMATVPIEAIVKPPTGSADYAVFVLDARQGRQIARLRPVTLGDALGHAVVVTRGVSIGDKVIVRGATLVVDGETVRVIPG